MAGVAAPLVTRVATPRPKRVRAAWWVVPPLLALGILVGYPLAYVVLQSTRNDDSTASVGMANWHAALSDSTTWKSLRVSLEIAAASTIGALVIGSFLALVLVFLPFPGAKGIVRCIEAVVCFPSFLLPLAFGVLFGSVGVLPHFIGSLTGSTPAMAWITQLPGVVLAEIAFFTPFVVRPVMAAMAEVPRDQVDVASSLGAGTWTVVWRVILPAIRTALLAAGGLVFLLTFNELGIVLFTGAKDVQTLPLQIYSQSVVTFHFGSAAVLACLQVVVSLFIYATYRSLLARRSC